MNRQIYPNSLSPLTGDVASTIGSPTATVTGIQGQQVDPTTPQAQQLLVYGSDGVWHPEDPVVSGTDAPGSPSSKNPVQVAGIDDGNLVRELRTDPYGSLRSLAIEEKLDTLILLMRALIAAVITDLPVNDSEFKADNFQDSQVGA